MYLPFPPLFCPFFQSTVDSHHRLKQSKSELLYLSCSLFFSFSSLYTSETVSVIQPLNFSIQLVSAQEYIYNTLYITSTRGGNLLVPHCSIQIDSWGHDSNTNWFTIFPRFLKKMDSHTFENQSESPSDWIAIQMWIYSSPILIKYKCIYSLKNSKDFLIFFTIYLFSLSSTISQIQRGNDKGNDREKPAVSLAMIKTGCFTVLLSWSYDNLKSNSRKLHEFKYMTSHVAF